MNKKAIVTGASRGIGKAICQQLSQNGFSVTAIARNQSQLEKLKSELPQVAIASVDLSRSEDIKKFASDYQKQSSSLHVLVNNAGIFHRHEAPLEADLIWQQQFETNLMGPVRLTQALWKLLKDAQGASVVNISSTLGLKPTADTSAYSAMKAALNNWTVALALAGASHKIRVNCVCPGIVETPIHDFFHLDQQEKEKFIGQLNPLQPLNRIGQPEDIAHAVTYFATDKSSWTTGSLLNVDGGIHIT